MVTISKTDMLRIMVLNVFGHNPGNILSDITKSKGKPPLIYYSTSSFSMNYFFVAHIFYLSQIYKMQKANYVIIFNDIGRENEPLIRLLSHEKINAKISEVYSLLGFFDIPAENVKIHTASESWRRYLLLNEDAPSRFLQGILFLDHAPSLPAENAALQFLQTTQTYELSDIVQKYIDLLISSNYNEIFPEDFGDAVDIHCTSYFSYPLVQKIKSSLIQRNNESVYIPKVCSFPKMPFFGHNPKIFPEHIAPEVGMTMTEIRNSIELYSVNKRFISLIFDNFLNKAMREFVHFDGKKRYFSSKPPVLSKMTLKQQRVTLGENLYKLLQQIKVALDSRQPTNPIILSGNLSASEVLKLLKSPIALEVLKITNGSNKISDIAKRLKKHQPNISKIISQLKARGLVRFNSSKRPIRTFNKIEINL